MDLVVILFSVFGLPNNRCTCRPNLVITGSCTCVLYLFLSSGVQPPSNLLIPGVTKRSVTCSFAASPTSGATYKVTFVPQRAGIAQPPTETFNNGGFRTKSGLIPDVTYRLQVVAVLNNEESAAISVNFTTLPDGKIMRVVCYINAILY